MLYRTWFTVAAVLMAAGFLGCGSTTPPAAPTPEKPATDEHAAHDHGEAPHGGTIADWGGGTYHVEFAVDHDKKEATVYVLGSDAQSPAPIQAESIHLTINDPMTDLDLTAQPLAGDPVGASSRFVGTHDTIGIVKEFAGTISGQIDGTPYTGDFKEEPHAHQH